jgi:hypothetical protein
MTLTALPAAPPQSIHLRDGELVLYRRSRSLLYQCRYRLADGSWVRQTIGKAALEHAIARACDIYDEARYRQRLGLAHRTHSVAQIAAVCCAALRQQIDARACWWTVRGKRERFTAYDTPTPRWLCWTVVLTYTHCQNRWATQRQ